MPLSINNSLKFTPDNYFPVESEKSGICIHHTVGASAASSITYWAGKQVKMGTAYVIDRDGTVYEVFDPKFWAWQFGLKSAGWSYEDRVNFEKRFVGIEIASEGALKESGGKLYCFDTVSPRTEKPFSEAFDYGSDYRGYRYFDKYEPAQVDSLIELMNQLIGRFGIDKKVPEDKLKYYGQEMKNFNGVIGHTMVRKDKTDPIPDLSFWNRVSGDCGLTDVTISNNQTAGRNKMTEAEKDTLFENNVQEINKMYVPAGSMIKGVIMELAEPGRDTFIKLRDAVPGGHVVYYDFVEGDQSLINRIGIALGLKEVTNDKLEVRGG